MTHLSSQLNIEINQAQTIYSIRDFTGEVREEFCAHIERVTELGERVGGKRVRLSDSV